MVPQPMHPQCLPALVLGAGQRFHQESERILSARDVLSREKPHRLEISCPPLVPEGQAEGEADREIEKPVRLPSEVRVGVEGETWE
jgi:hypothetical protein